MFKSCVANDYPLVHFLCVKNMGFQKHPNCCGHGLSIHMAGDVWEEEGRTGGEAGGGEGGGPLALFTDQKLTNHESGISTFISVFESHKQHVKYRF